MMNREQRESEFSSFITILQDHIGNQRARFPDLDFELRSLEGFEGRLREVWERMVAKNQFDSALVLLAVKFKPKVAESILKILS